MSEHPLHTPADAPHEKRPHSTARCINAWIAASISALFFAHAILGCVWLFWPDVPSTMKWLVWVGVFAIAVHITFSVITTYQMFTDTVRPPSKTKKAHQWKKWITGTLLVVSALVHQGIDQGILSTGTDDSTRAFVLAGVLAVVAVFLCIHVCTGVKSLTRDMNLDARFRNVARALAIVLCAGLCVALAVFALA